MDMIIPSGPVCINYYLHPLQLESVSYNLVRVCKTLIYTEYMNSLFNFITACNLTINICGNFLLSVSNIFFETVAITLCSYNIDCEAKALATVHHGLNQLPLLQWFQKLMTSIFLSTLSSMYINDYMYNQNYKL